MMKTFGLLLVLAFKTYLVYGQNIDSNDYDVINMTIPEDIDTTVLINGTIDEAKALLRYGFQRTHKCQVFNKAYLCITKCLDAGYQIAESNKQCKCKCYKNKVLAEYKQSTKKSLNKGASTAPTTSLPPWVSPENVLEPYNDTELYGDLEGPDKNEGESGEKSEGDNGSGDGSGDDVSGEEHSDEENPEEEHSEEEHPEEEHSEEEHPEEEHSEEEHPEEEHSEEEHPEEEHPEGEEDHPEEGGEENPEGEPEAEPE